MSSNEVGCFYGYTIRRGTPMMLKKTIFTLSLLVVLVPDIVAAVQIADDELHQAIQKSDLKQVEHILRHNQLSQEQLDLAHKHAEKIIRDYQESPLARFLYDNSTALSWSRARGLAVISELTSRFVSAVGVLNLAKDLYTTYKIRKDLQVMRIGYKTVEMYHTDLLPIIQQEADKLLAKISMHKAPGLKPLLSKDRIISDNDIKQLVAAVQVPFERLTQESSFKAAQGPLPRYWQSLRPKTVAYIALGCALGCGTKLFIHKMRQYTKNIETAHQIADLLKVEQKHSNMYTTTEVLNNITRISA